MSSEEGVNYQKIPVSFGNSVRTDRNIDKVVFYGKDIEYIDNKPVFSVSQTLIKVFTDKKLQVKNYCPFKVLTCYVIKSHGIVKNLNMDKGNYFEYLCLGTNVHGAVTDLPRINNISKSKTIDQLRIEEQAINFKRLCVQYGFVVTPDNVQKTYKELYKHKFENDCIVYLKGVVDFEHKIWHNNQFIDAIIDLKLTRNMKSTFGEFSWGAPEYMDHIQFDMYSFLTKKVCVYWVFDYSKELNNDIFMHHLDDTKMKDLHDRINRTIIELMYCHDSGWEAKGDYNSCNDCPHNPKNTGSCKNAVNIKSI